MKFTSLLIKMVTHIDKRPFVYMWLCIFTSLAMGAGVVRLSVDSSNESLFKKGDSVLTSYQDFQKQFGRNDIVIIAIESEDVQSSNFYQSLQSLHYALEHEVPWVEDVSSLVNADWIESTQPSQLTVSDVGDLWAGGDGLSTAHFNEIKQSSLYKDTLISRGGKMVLVVVRALTGVAPKNAKKNAEADFFADQEAVSKNFTDKTEDKGLSSAQLDEFATGIQAILREYENKGMNLKAAGGPLLDKLHHDAMHHDVLALMAAAFAVVIIALFLLFRQIIAVVLPIVVVGLSLLSVFGMMGWLGIPITPVSQALPSLLLTVGVLDAVHLFGMFYMFERRGKSLKDSLIATVEHSGVAVLFTSLTTAAGFIGFVFARMKPIADFGWVAAFGTLLILAYTLILLPALIEIFYRKQPRSAQPNQLGERVISGMVTLSGVGARYPYRVMAGVLFLILIAWPGVQKVDFSYDVLSWFPKDEKIRVDTISIDNKIKATVPLEVVIDTGVERGILTPEFMAALRQFQDYAESINEGPVSVGRATSIVDVLERTHSEISGVPLGTLPKTKSLISQEMLLYESGGAREIERLIDRQYSKARITVRLAWADGKDMVPLRQSIEDRANEIFSGFGEVQVTGTVDLVSTGAVELISSMSSSYLFASITITLMLIVLWSSLRLGLLAAIPNFIVIYLAIAIMGYTGMTINMITVLLGGIILGLAVDDTVHLINAMRHHIAQKDETVIASIEMSMRTVAPMLLVTSLVLALGFSMFSLSMMSVLKSFGLLLAASMIFALMFDLLVTPAILSLLSNGQAKK